MGAHINTHTHPNRKRMHKQQQEKENKDLPKQVWAQLNVSKVIGQEGGMILREE